MTILITPFTDKKGDKLVVPLVTSDQLQKTTEGARKDEEAQQDIVYFNGGARRLSHSTVMGLFLAALIVVSIGILGGFYFHRHYLHFPRYEYRMNIDTDKSYAYNSEPGAFFYDKYTADKLSSYSQLNEGLEIDMLNEEYEKIDVPDFRDGRNGRFIHDFNINTTGIIDLTGHRCFVMPLNRENVLPPKSFFDLMNKLFDGYYKVNTQVVRENMRVIFPPLEDTKEVGLYIAQECKGMPIYKLEQYENGVVKRSAELPKEAKFSEFSGKGIIEVDIVNFSEVEAYERRQ